MFTTFSVKNKDCLIASTTFLFLFSIGLLVNSHTYIHWNIKRNIIIISYFFFPGYCRPLYLPTNPKIGANNLLTWCPSIVDWSANTCTTTNTIRKRAVQADVLDANATVELQLHTRSLSGESFFSVWDAAETAHREISNQKCLFYDPLQSGHGCLDGCVFVTWCAAKRDGVWASSVGERKSSIRVALSKYGGWAWLLHGS